MEANKEYPDGLIYFPSKASAPEWADGKIIIYPKKLGAWMKANPEFVTKYNGEDQVVLDINKSKESTAETPKGYARVNTYKKEEVAATVTSSNDDDLFG